MLELAPEERILLLIRRHWIVLFGPMILGAAFLVIPPASFFIAPFFLPLLALPAITPILNFALALYLLGLSAYLLVLWLSYYLDVWIITTRRIIDVEQHGLFRRQISEIALERVQNVTIEIPGFVATLLRFGNLKIQTAGEGEFTISDVTDFYRAKDLILQYSRQPHDAPGSMDHSEKAGRLPRALDS